MRSEIKLPRGALPGVARTIGVPVSTVRSAWNRQDPTIVAAVAEYMKEKCSQSAKNLLNLKEIKRLSERKPAAQE